MAQPVVRNCTLVRFAVCTVHNWIWTTENRLASETDRRIDTQMRYLLMTAIHSMALMKIIQLKQLNFFFLNGCGTALGNLVIDVKSI